MSEFHLDTIFDRTICPDLFSVASPAESPVSLFVGGQPGAGKTRAVGRVLASYGGDVVPIVGDDLRAYHPDYDTLMATDPLAMPERTAAASGYWIGQAVEYAHAHAYSCLIEGTWRRAATVLDTARSAKKCARATHAVIVAVPPALSLASIAERFYGDLSRGEHARWTPLAAHDIAVENIQETLTRVCASPWMDEVSVASRENPGLATSTDVGMDGVTAVFAREFSRPLTEAERAYVSKLLPFVRDTHARLTPHHEEGRVLLDRIEASLTAPVMSLHRPRVPHR